MENNQKEINKEVVDKVREKIDSGLGPSDNSNGKRKKVEEILRYNRSFVKSICKSLNYPSTQYKAQITINLIIGYLNSEKHLSRFLYSELSSNIFQLQEHAGGDNPILTNLEKLLEIVINDQYKNSSDVSSDKIKEIVLRMFDHIHLAELQIDLIKKTRESSEEAKKETEKYKNVLRSLFLKLQNVQRDYIAILGIFATVVITFIGGTVFSSAVLQTMKDVSIYRLIAVIILLGATLFNMIYILMRYLLISTEKVTKPKEEEGTRGQEAEIENHKKISWKKRAGNCIKEFFVYFSNLIHYILPFQNKKMSFVERVNRMFLSVFLGDVIFWLIDVSLIRSKLRITIFKWIFGE